MTTEDHVDILHLAGIDRSDFVSGGQDVSVKTPEGNARIFRRGGMVVYRAGDVWGDDIKVDPIP